MSIVPQSVYGDIQLPGTNRARINRDTGQPSQGVERRRRRDTQNLSYFVNRPPHNVLNGFTLNGFTVNGLGLTGLEDPLHNVLDQFRNEKCFRIPGSATNHAGALGFVPLGAESALAQDAARHFAVIEINGAVPQHLVGLVALAGQQHDVAGPRLVESALDRNRAVGLNQVLRIGLLQAHHRIVDSPQRVFTARVVAGEHDNIARAPGRLAHQRALGAVAVAATAKQGDDAPGGVELPRGGQQVTQRVVGVRIIDDE